MIVVNNIGKLYTAVIRSKENEELARVSFKQLTYKERSDITARTYDLKGGEVQTDLLGQVFLTLKYCLKEVSGFSDSEGEDFSIQFDKDGYVEDDCLDSLLNTKVGNELQIISNSVSSYGMVDKILNPLTGVVFEGIDMVPYEKREGLEKK